MDLCNQHGVVLQLRRFMLDGGGWGSVTAVVDAPEGKRVGSIVIGGWSALEFEIEPK
jgi:hypothetical protein